MNARTVVLTIGGSDSGGGAGIQADLKTFSALGVHGTSAITAVTAQNTLRVKEVFPMESRAVLSQMEAVLSDFEISWAVTGMLPTAGVVNAVADASEKYGLNLVVDPVIKAEAGGRLFSQEAVAALKDRLIPIARIITPNIFEARNLTGIQVTDLVSAEEAARAILDMGAGAAVVKGGHLDCTDLLLQGGAPELIRGRREHGGNHGVGCTYSSALTAFLAALDRAMAIELRNLHVPEFAGRERALDVHLITPKEVRLGLGDAALLSAVQAAPIRVWAR